MYNNVSLGCTAETVVNFPLVKNSPPVGFYAKDLRANIGQDCRTCHEELWNIVLQAQLWLAGWLVEVYVKVCVCVAAIHCIEHNHTLAIMCIEVAGSNLVLV